MVGRLYEQSARVVAVESNTPNAIKDFSRLVFPPPDHTDASLQRRVSVLSGVDVMPQYRQRFGITCVFVSIMYSRNVPHTSTNCFKTGVR